MGDCNGLRGTRCKACRGGDSEQEGGGFFHSWKFQYFFISSVISVSSVAKSWGGGRSGGGQGTEEGFHIVARFTGDVGLHREAIHQLAGLQFTWVSVEKEGHFCPGSVQVNSESGFHSDLAGDFGIQKKLDKLVRGLGAGGVFRNRKDRQVFEATFDGGDPVVAAGKFRHERDGIAAVDQGNSVPVLANRGADGFKGGAVTVRPYA